MYPIRPLLAALLATAAIAAGDPIEVHVSRWGHFSSTEAEDEIAATLTAPNCESAELVIEIRKRSTTLFRRAVPLDELYPCERWDAEPAEARSRASRIVNELVAFVPADSRRCWDPRGEVVGCVEAPFLRKLREANASLVCFPTGAEAGSCVGFHPESGTVVEALTFAH